MHWLGHSCFSFTSPQGIRIVTDPYSTRLGYPPVRVDADVVTISHEHHDHNYVEAVAGSPRLLRGLAPDGSCVPMRETAGDVAIATVVSHHYPEGGEARRGLNAVFTFKCNGVTVVHLGDLGRPLTSDQVAALTPVDVLFLPVGGFYTIGPEEAAQEAARLKPRVIVPMHYKTEFNPDSPVGVLDTFTRLFPAGVVVPMREDWQVFDPVALPQGDPEVWIPNLTATGVRD